MYFAFFPVIVKHFIKSKTKDWSFMDTFAFKIFPNATLCHKNELKTDYRQCILVLIRCKSGVPIVFIYVVCFNSQANSEEELLFVAEINVFHSSMEQQAISK